MQVPIEHVHAPLNHSHTPLHPILTARALEAKRKRPPLGRIFEVDKVESIERELYVSTMYSPTLTVL